MIYNTWNSSIRKMFRLDRTTHRYFIEPISKTSHIKASLLERFMNVTNKLMCSGKIAAKNLFNIIRNECNKVQQDVIYGKLCILRKESNFGNYIKRDI